MKTILGVKLDGLDTKQTINRLYDFLHSDGQYQIATINPEFIVDAQTNLEFKRILNSCALNTVDGFGLKLAGWFKKYNFKRCTGVDLITNLVQSDYAGELKVFLLGGRQGVSYAASKKLQRLNSDLKIVGDMSGFINAKEPTLLEYNSILEKINYAEPNLLLVAYNAPEAQNFIAEYLDKMPSVKIAIGLGGTFDFLAGTIRRAPKIWRAIGLEWLWRLLQEPRRIKRIYKAIFKFLYLFFKNDNKIDK